MTDLAPPRSDCWQLVTTAPDVALYQWSSGKASENTTPPSPLVLIHGLGDCAEIWHDVVASLPHDPGPIFALDLPGHGRANTVAGGTTRDMAERVAQVMVTVLGATPFRLAGHSLGADVALHLATGPMRDQVTQLALLDFVGRMAQSAAQLVPAGLRDRQTDVEDAATFGDRLKHHLPFASEDALRRYADRCFEIGQTRPPFNLATLETQRFLSVGALSIVPDFDARMGRVRCDIAILHASMSALLDRHTASRAAERHGAQLISIPRAGHALCLDNPTGVAAALAEVFDLGTSAS